ncbi:MAG: tyrosine-type recombinase/integrase [Clostridia bacterium]|nr:tyrosine-type recombinase/integrase [[Bacteroides] pectinophilus]MDD5873218.1 tyrosine-type recombinase/integrase [Clostridia bacterium]
MAGTYSEQQRIKYTQKLNDIMDMLPDFTRDYFFSLEYTKQPRTKVAYAMDLRGFFEFIRERKYNSYESLKQITLADTENISSTDIIEYLRHSRLYVNKNGREVTNSERAAKRKLSSLRSFYGYYNKQGLMKKNPAFQVDMPKIHDQAITRLDVNEVAELLDNVESGNRLTKNQLAAHEGLKTRDLALLTLLLGTGIRVSECVGLDINDVDFDNDRIKVVRKGGAESFVYFGDEVREALLDYMDERSTLQPAAGHENALFISRNNKRLCVRSVENLVKKYAMTVTTVKHITPHKLRSTYGTNLYQESNDIYLVADVLGHKDVNTTRKHYAEIVDNNRRKARNMVQLRENDGH